MSINDYTNNRSCAGTCSTLQGQTQSCVGTDMSCGCPDGAWDFIDCYIVPDVDPCDNISCPAGQECNNGACVESIGGCLDTGINSTQSLHPFGLCDNAVYGTDSYCACNSSTSFTLDCNGDEPSVSCGHDNDCYDLGMVFAACSVNGKCIDISCCEYPYYSGPVTVPEIDINGQPDFYLHYQCELNNADNYCIYDLNCNGGCSPSELLSDDCGVCGGSCFEYDGCDCDCPAGYDCFDICGGSAEMDDCGVCDPCNNGTAFAGCDLWNMSCTGCTDPNAINYDLNHITTCTNDTHPAECSQNSIIVDNCCCMYSGDYIIYTCTDINAMNYNILCEETIILTEPNNFDLELCMDNCGDVYMDCLFSPDETPHGQCMISRDECEDECETNANIETITTEIESPYTCYDDSSCRYPVNLPEFTYIILQTEPSVNDYGQYFYSSNHSEWGEMTGLDSIESIDDLSTTMTPNIDFGGAESTTGTQIAPINLSNVPNEPVYSWMLPSFFSHLSPFMYLVKFHTVNIYERGLTLGLNAPSSWLYENFQVDNAWPVNRPFTCFDDVTGLEGWPGELPWFGYPKGTISAPTNCTDDFYWAHPTGDDCTDNPDACGAYKSLGLSFYALTEEQNEFMFAEDEINYEVFPKPVYEFILDAKGRRAFVISLDGDEPVECIGENSIGCIPIFEEGGDEQHYPSVVTEDIQSLGISFYAFAEQDESEILTPIVECYNMDPDASVLAIHPGVVGYAPKGQCPINRDLWADMYAAAWSTIYTDIVVTMSGGTNEVTDGGFNLDVFQPYWTDDFNAAADYFVEDDVEGNIVFYAYPNRTLEHDIIRPISHAYIGTTDTNIKFLNKYYNINDVDYLYTSAPNIVNISFDITDDYAAQLITSNDIIENYEPFRNNNKDFVFMIVAWDGVNLDAESIKTEYLSKKSNGDISLNSELIGASDLYTYQFLRDSNNNINYFSQQYSSSGVKVVKAIFAEIDLLVADGDIGQFNREKIVTIKLNLNTDEIYIEDFQDIGGPDFVYLPWPYPGSTPIINGFTPNSKYMKSIENILQSDTFDETELIEQSLAQRAINNDELGDFINKIDIEQVRVFNTGRYDIGALLQIENYYTNILDPSKEKLYTFYPHTDIGPFDFWDGIYNQFPRESSVGNIFINDMIDENIKSECILELNCGEFDTRVIRDSSGSGNKGIVVGDFHVEKLIKGQPATRRGPIDVPKKDKKNRAL